MLKAQTQTESAENTVFPWAADSAVDEVSPSQPDRGYSEVHPPLKTLQRASWAVWSLENQEKGKFGTELRV